MKERILIIEDDESFCKTLTHLLEKEGYQVVGASGGQQAIEAAKETFFELIVADVRLPGGMDGIEAIAKIKEIRPTAKGIVIIITGYANEEAPLRAIKVGVDDYIYKPFKMEEFLHSVERNIKIYRLEEEKKRHTETIEKMEKELEDYSRNLEQKVQERTKELEGANQQLRATQTQLVQSAKMAAIGQLGAGVAHELNNPLGGVLGYAQFILEKFKRPEFGIEGFKACQKYLEHIEKESARCRNIVENLLSFSKRSISLKPEPIDIRKPIEDTLTIFGHQLGLQNIKLTTDFGPDLARVISNASQLQQVFTDLILNAQEAMPDGGQLKIRAENIIDKETQRPKQIRIEFTDTGCGIPEENLQRIFEPFFTTREKEKATGLGLSISYQIIKDHKGNIEVTSQVGKGTTFIITLPVVDG